MSPEIHNWAMRHGVSPQALAELAVVFGTADTHHESPNTSPGSEGAVQNLTRYETAKMGWRVFRNNVGVLTDKRGVPVRYGLANDTKAMNQIVKSSDLIGIKPVLVTQDHVGQTIGQFVSLEIKKEGWVFAGSEREKAQLSWLQLVSSLGGYAKFVNNVDKI